MSTSVQGWVLPHLIRWVEQQGFDSTAIRQLPGLGDLDDPDGRVPEASAEAAWRLAAGMTADRCVGLHVAESLPRGALDLVEYAFRSSASLGAGLERLARYGRVISDRVAAKLERQGEALILVLQDAGASALHPARAEFGLAMALKLARECTDTPITPLRVCFAHPAPDDCSEHRRFFRGPLCFDAGTNSMLLDGADGVREMHAADEALSSIVRRRLEKVLAAREVHASAPLSERVRHLIVSQLGSQRLTPDAVARTLAVSRRTLSRRLADDGTSFRAILDDVRRDFACALLQDGSLSIADVTFFLQYSEAAVFNRSFRRWTGQTPREYREASHASAN